MSVCPECGSQEIINDSVRGEVICKSCGLVISEHMIDYRDSGFIDKEEEKRIHRGLPTTHMLPDKGLATVISRRERDIHDRGFSPLKYQSMVRIRRLDGRMTWRKRNLAIASTEIRRLRGQLNLPKMVEETAAVFYRKVLKKGLLRGQSIRAMATAALYAACRLVEVPRTFEEILSKSSARKTVVSRCYRILVLALKLRFPPPNPTLLVPQFANKLNLTGKTESIVEKKAVSILKDLIRKKRVAGKDPRGLVAATLYIACQESGLAKSQSFISKVVGITEVTLRTRYREIRRIMEDQ
ncbi:MAG: transcription initiation factor IIB family protein [Candidatus Hodarchaeota archaeon]